MCYIFGTDNFIYIFFLPPHAIPGGGRLKIIFSFLSMFFFLVGSNRVRFALTKRNCQKIQTKSGRRKKRLIRMSAFMPIKTFFLLNNYRNGNK